jgi:hypothetical protein
VVEVAVATTTEG